MFYGTGIGFAARGLNSAKRYMHCREPTKRRCSMNAYTVSRLALDAGVSVHIVRDYLLRGLLRPVACTTGGYGLFDDAALQRLCFVHRPRRIGAAVPGAGCGELR
jgi:MerR family mercuric resistance operon transcriptional regulator